MNRTVQQLRARWSTMATRERRAVMLAAGVLAVAVLWLALLHPALRTLRQAPGDIAKLQAQLRNVQVQANELEQLGKVPHAPTAEVELRGTLLDWMHRHAPDTRVEVGVRPAGASLQVHGMRPTTLLELARVARHDWNCTVSLVKLQHAASGGFDGRVQLTRRTP